MRWFRDISVRWKLTLLLVAMVSVVLVLSSVSQLLRARQRMRDDLVNQYSTLANVLAANIAPALTLDRNATQVLLSDLQVEEAIELACAYDLQGKVVASYQSDTGARSDPPELRKAGHTFTQDGRLELFKPVVSSGETAGTLLLRVNTAALRERLLLDVTIAAGILIGCLAFAVLLAYRLQRLVSQPVLELVAAVEAVRGSTDFSVRVEKRNNDELGVLCDGFNSMLTQLEARDELLRERTRELKLYSAELERSNKELADFGYVVSHDLKAPMRGIDNLVNWIEEDCQDVLPDVSKRHFRQLQQRVGRLERLLDDMLEYSRAGRVMGDVAEIDSGELVRGVVELLDPPEGFVVEVARDMPQLTTHTTLLDQVFRNLIGNAIKHHDRPDGQVTVSATDQGPFIEFCVADDGPGIAEEFQERIFRLFQTLKPRDEVEGSGMGLAVVKKVVESQGGRIEVESSGRGTTFRFTWPRNVAATANACVSLRSNQPN